MTEKKTMTTDIKIKFGETFNVWNKKNKNIVVANDATLPGIFLIFPIPKSVTNKKINLFIVVYNRSYYFTCYSFFFSN